MDRDRSYSTREICGEAFWRLLGKLEKRQAGMCVRHLVKQGAVGLVPVARKWPPLHYRPQ
jgi:hypothetical protein